MTARELLDEQRVLNEAMREEHNRIGSWAAKFFGAYLVFAAGWVIGGRASVLMAGGGLGMAYCLFGFVRQCVRTSRAIRAVERNTKAMNAETERRRGELAVTITREENEATRLLLDSHPELSKFIQTTDPTDVQACIARVTQKDGRMCFTDPASVVWAAQDKQKAR